MNSIQMFREYVKHHEPLLIPHPVNFENMYFCDTCNTCEIKALCDDIESVSVRHITLEPSDIKILSREYPEYFI